MQEEPIDILKIDAKYSPIEPFKRWSGCVVDAERWEQYTGRVQKLQKGNEELLKRSLEVVKKAAAIETGALENLYELPHGFTITAASQVAHLEAAFNESTEKARPYIQSQLEAYEMVLDFATHRRPIAEVWIRELHSQICKAQDNYKVRTAVGEQNLLLPKGSYKTMPNHVVKPDGKIHSYAPVSATSDEMHRFCVELGSQEFMDAHPIIQAAYSHYCLVRIHPFPDGNGRVARALGSVFTFRSNSMPLLILYEHRNAYLSALRKADKRLRQDFVDFLFERMITALQIVEQSILSANVPSAEDVLGQLDNLYRTRGGFNHTDVDAAGHRLFELYFTEVQKKFSERKSKSYTAELNTDAHPHSLQKPNTRHPISMSPRRATVHIRATAPAKAHVAIELCLEVPVDCGHDDEFFIVAPEYEEFPARMTDLAPNHSLPLQIRITMSVEKLISLAFNRLAELVQSDLKAKGYLGGVSK